MKRLLLPLLAAFLILSGCGKMKPPTPAAQMSVDAFLKQFNLRVAPQPERFQVKVPASWDVPLGAYPEGMYWGLAAEFARDAGFDLTRVKGQTADVWRYELPGGLPGQGEQSQFTYPSTAILLVQNEKVVGAWLAFNKHTVGPSVKGRYLEEVTGLPFERWVEKQGYFTAAGPNADLAKLGPVEVVATFADAVSKGDRTRAVACMDPVALRDVLTMNLEPGRLYNPDFGENNSLAHNIVRAQVLTAKMLDPDTPADEIRDIGARTRVELRLFMELKWRQQVFNTPDNRTTRFAILQKWPFGWKLGGLGTGP